MANEVPRHHVVAIAAAVAALLGERARVRRVSIVSVGAAEAQARPVLPTHRTWSRSGWRHSKAGRSGPWNSWQVDKDRGERASGASRSER